MDDEIGTGTRWAAFAMIVGAVMVSLYFFSVFDSDGETTMAERIERSAESNRRRGGHTWSSSSERRRRGEGGTYAPPGSAETEPDPQQRAYQRSFSSVPDAGAMPPFVPSLHIGRLASITGDAPAEEGARCEVRVLPVAANIFNCVVRVMCDGVVLYPDGAQSAGYAPCAVEDGIVTRAEDEDVTSADGDPALHVDLSARHVRVVDDGLGRDFSATIELRPI